MNKLDLTKTGGFPFTQDMLDWVQQNSLAVMNMLGAKCLPDSLANAANTPVGLVGINPNGGTVYKAGWLWYNNEILHFPADIDVSTLPALSGGLVYGFTIQETDTPVSYFDGTSHNTKISRTVTIASGTNTLTASFIPLTTQIYYFDNCLKETVETHVAITVSGITGDIYYRKNAFNNTLQIRGQVQIPITVGAPPQVYTLAVLPSTYRPVSQNVPFVGLSKYALSVNMDSTGKDYIKNVYMELLPTGELNILPILAGSSYFIQFNTVISLD